MQPIACWWHVAYEASFGSTQELCCSNFSISLSCESSFFFRKREARAIWGRGRRLKSPSLLLTSATTSFRVTGGSEARIDRNVISLWLLLHFSHGLGSWYYSPLSRLWPWSFNTLGLQSYKMHIKLPTSFVHSLFGNWSTIMNSVGTESWINKTRFKLCVWKPTIQTGCRCWILTTN